MGSLQLKSVRKSFGNVDVIKGIDLDVKDGEFVIFVGPSGCGKSTLLRIIAGLEDATSGSITIDGTEVVTVPPAKRGIAMVFQSYALYPHLTVKDNMGLGLKQAGAPKDEIERRVAKASSMLSLEKYLARRPAELSGGQRQRVAIGRAIVRHPQVFLFDEPLSNLDAELRVHMRIEIARLHKELKATMIYVTHDQVEAMTLADKIVVLREGEIAQVGAPLQLYDNPDNLFVAGFIGSPKMNFMAAEVVDRDNGKLVVALANHGGTKVALPIADSSANKGDKVTLGVRPEHFADAGKGDSDITVGIDVAEHLGQTSYLYARAPGGEQLIIEREESRDHGALDSLTVAISARHAFLFDAAGKRLR